MEKKTLKEKLKKINIIDLMAVVLIVLVALVVLWKVADKILPFDKDPGTASSSTVNPNHGATSQTPVGSGAASSSGEKEDPMVYVTFTVRAENKPAAMYEKVQEHIPSQLMMSGVLYDGWVVGVEKEPVLVLASDGTWVEDPKHVTLLFTVEATVPRAEIMTTLVGTQEVRIGDPGYDLNTEYLEFRDTTVVDMKWEDWDFGADRKETNKEKLEKKGLQPITYVVRAENRPAALYENVKEYIPSQLMASGALHYGWIVGVEKEPVMVLTAGGEWVEDPAHVTLLFTVEAYVPRTDVKTTLVGTQEVRIGRPQYTLKTEYLEFRNTTVVDIDWGR